MQTCKEMVQEFHKSNGAVINGSKNGSEVAVLRLRLILEEWAETLAALHENDVVEVADGLTDLLYVIYGTAVSYGVKCRDAFTDPLGRPATEFERADVLRFIRLTMPRLQRVVMSLTMIPDDCGAALEDLAACICDTGARTWGLPMQELFIEVHHSNMTKTFAKNTTGGKYGAVKPKGPGYEPPDIAGILAAAAAPQHA
jgi:predicted HAD superfamily Cof-like phosphohydrolase